MSRRQRKEVEVQSISYSIMENTFQWRFSLVYIRRHKQTGFYFNDVTQFYTQIICWKYHTKNVQIILMRKLMDFYLKNDANTSSTAGRQKPVIKRSHSTIIKMYNKWYQWTIEIIEFHPPTSQSSFSST